MGHDGTLLGFLKLLVTEDEAFIEEVLVAEISRGQGIMHHLFVATAQILPAVKRLRLQVKRGIRAHGIYKALGFREWQPWRFSPPWSQQRPDHGYRLALFMHATAGEVLAKATAHLVAKQRELRHWRIWRQATYPIPGVELGYTAARVHAQPEAEVAQGEDTAFSPVRRTLRSGSTREGPYQRPPQPARDPTEAGPYQRPPQRARHPTEASIVREPSSEEDDELWSDSD